MANTTKQQLGFGLDEKEREYMSIPIGTETIDFEVHEPRAYTYVFQKSLSNVRTTSDILPLMVENIAHVHTEYTIESDDITLRYTPKADHVPFINIHKSERYERLQILKNARTLLESAEKGYTYVLHPLNLFYDDNKMLAAMYVGYDQTLPPIEQSEHDLVRQYQCLVMSTLDTKYDYETLYNGAIDFAKKTPFLQRLYEIKTIQEAITLVEEAYFKEKEVFHQHHRVVTKTSYASYRIIGIVAAIVATLVVIPLIYTVFYSIPTQERYLEASSAFVSGNYGKTTTILRNDAPEQLPQATKYILSYSYLEEEPMSEVNKKSARKTLSIKSDDRILEYWIYLGREDYKKAMNYALELNNDQFKYHAAYRAVEIISDSTSLSGEEKQEELKKYTEERDRLDKELRKSKAAKQGNIESSEEKKEPTAEGEDQLTETEDTATDTSETTSAP